MALTRIKTGQIEDGEVKSSDLDSNLEISGTFTAQGGYENLPTQFTVFGRNVNTIVPVANGALTVVGRSSNTDIGIS